MIAGIIYGIGILIIGGMTAKTTYDHKQWMKQYKLTN